MTTSVAVTTGNGTIGAVTSWSITGDDATPTVVGAISGSTGNLSLTGTPTSESRYLNGDTVAVSTTSSGTFSGVVDSLTVDTVGATITAGGLLSACNITVTAPPMYGSATLQDAYSTYIGLCFTTPPAIDFSGMSSNPTVAYEGWTGVAWDYLRNLAAATKTEIAVVNGVIVIRDIGLRTVDLGQHTDADVSVTPNTQDTALTVQVVNRNTTSVASVGDFIYNYALNPSVETNATDWSYGITGDATPGTGQMYTTVPVRSSTTPAYGTFSYRGIVQAGTKLITMGFKYVAGGRQGVKFDASTMTAGSTIYGAISIRASVTQAIYAEFIQLFAEILWYTAGGSLISTTSGTITTVDPTATAAYVRKTISSTVPANAAYGILYGNALEIDWSDGAPATPTLTIAVDGAVVSNGSDTTYKDGSSASWAWSGSVNNSTSYTTNPNNTSFYNALTDPVNPNNIITVNAGQVTKGTLTALGSPAALAQPVRVTTTTVGVGQYVVSASDGLPIAAAQFEAYGGSLVVSVSATPNSIDYVFTGPTTAIPGVAGPYSIAVSDGTNSYATLNIAGAGTLSSPQTVTFDTGAGNTKNPVYGPVDIPFLTTLADTNDRGIELAHQYGGGTQTINFGLSVTDALGLGLTPGALVTWKENKYRIVSTTVEEATVSCTAVARPLSSDFDTVWASKTGTDFDALWASKAYTDADFTVSPLRAV